MSDIVSSFLVRFRVNREGRGAKGRKRGHRAGRFEGQEARGRKAEVGACAVDRGGEPGQSRETKRECFPWKSKDLYRLINVVRPCLLRSSSGASKAPGHTSHSRAFTRGSLRELSPEPTPRMRRPLRHQLLRKSPAVTPTVGRTPVRKLTVGGASAGRHAQPIPNLNMTNISTTFR